ncbi:MAG: retropepsin-like domain-containing protein [Acidobacteriota bacterium]|nr:retropepsin-like domain-containing protein [Acidobacteriota bacterium]
MKINAFSDTKLILRLTSMIAVIIFFVINSFAQNSSAKSDSYSEIKLSAYQEKQFSVKAMVGGKERTFLFDTGEGITMISPQVAADLGCEPWGNIVGFRMLGERFDAPRCDDVKFDMAGTVFRVPNTVVYDLAKISGAEAPPIDGAIGLDMFAGRTITLEMFSKRLIIETEKSVKRRTKTGIEVPLRISRSEGGALDVNLGVRTNRGLLWMELDSANAGPTVFVAPAVAALLDLDAKTRQHQSVKLNFGSGVTFEGKARVFPDMIIDGNIGMQFLGNRAITLDLKNSRAWVSPATISSS